MQHREGGHFLAKCTQSSTSSHYEGNQLPKTKHTSRQLLPSWSAKRKSPACGINLFLPKTPSWGSLLDCVDILENLVYYLPTIEAIGKLGLG